MKTIRITALSDLHGYLPDVPDCELLLLAGDYLPTPEAELQFLHGPFRRWVEELANRMKIVAIAGNHDLLFESDPHLLPDLPWTYLQDSGTEFQGLKIYGSPWHPQFFNWAFNVEESLLRRTGSQLSSGQEFHWRTARKQKIHTKFQSNQIDARYFLYGV